MAAVHGPVRLPRNRHPGEAVAPVLDRHEVAERVHALEPHLRVVGEQRAPRSLGSCMNLEKVVFGSDIFGGEIEEFDREIDRYRKMLEACGVGQDAQANIFGGTLRKILDRK